MAIGIHNCWACDKKLVHDRDVGDYFFWCDKKCHDRYVAETAEKGKTLREWSSYMAGERSCPKGMEPHPSDAFKAELTKKEKRAGRKPIKPVKAEKALNAMAKAALSKKKGKKTVKGSKRIRKMMEAPKRTVICGNCGTPGHNSRTCEE